MSVCEIAIAKFGAEVFKASILNLLWGDHLPKYVCLPSFVYQYSRNLCSITGGDPLAKVGLSAKSGVVVFTASILNSLGGPSAKVGSSGKFGVLHLANMSPLS